MFHSNTDETSEQRWKTQPKMLAYSFPLSTQYRITDTTKNHSPSSIHKYTSYTVHAVHQNHLCCVCVWNVLFRNSIFFFHAYCEHMIFYYQDRPALCCCALYICATWMHLLPYTTPNSLLFIVFGLVYIQALQHPNAFYSYSLWLKATKQARYSSISKKKIFLFTFGSLMNFS